VGDGGGEIGRIASTLRMPGLVGCKASIDPAGTIDENIMAVLRDRESEILAQRLSSRVKRAGFPSLKTFDEFDGSSVPAETWAKASELRTCRFIAERLDVAAVGIPGSGKTHLATAVGHEAAKLGFSVKFTTVRGLLDKMSSAAERGALGKLIRQLRRQDLLILDQLGLPSAPFLPIEASRLFEVVEMRHENASTFITTTCEFSKWDALFADKALTAALVDRIAHHAVVLAMGRRSWRLTHAHGASQPGMGGEAR
jgi:DNA replication protein DnaC